VLPPDLRVASSATLLVVRPVRLRRQPAGGRSAASFTLPSSPGGAASSGGWPQG